MLSKIHGTVGLNPLKYASQSTGHQEAAISNEIPLVQENVVIASFGAGVDRHNNLIMMSPDVSLVDKTLSFAACVRIDNSNMQKWNDKLSDVAWSIRRSPVLARDFHPIISDTNCARFVADWFKEIMKCHPKLNTSSALPSNCTFVNESFKCISTDAKVDHRAGSIDSIQLQPGDIIAGVVIGAKSKAEINKVTKGMPINNVLRKIDNHCRMGHASIIVLRPYIRPYMNQIQINTDSPSKVQSSSVPSNSVLKGALTAGVVVPVAAMNAGMKSIGVGAQTRKDVIPGMVGGTVGAGVRAGVRHGLNRLMRK